jgi:hypothetical protein
MSIFIRRHNPDFTKHLRHTFSRDLPKMLIPSPLVLSIFLSCPVCHAVSAVAEGRERQAHVLDPRPVCHGCVSQPSKGDCGLSLPSYIRYFATL